MGGSFPYDPTRGLELLHAQTIGCTQNEVLVCGGGTAGIWLHYPQPGGARIHWLLNGKQP